MTDTPATPATQEPWSGCFDCGHPAHPFTGNRDVRCGVPTNNGNPADGPEPCECVQWSDVLDAYAAIEREASASAATLERAVVGTQALVVGLHRAMTARGMDTAEFEQMVREALSEASDLLTDDDDPALAAAPQEPRRDAALREGGEAREP